MTSGSHVIRCRDTGEALANKLDGGECVCKPGECEMRKLRNREGDYAKNNSEAPDSFDAVGFAIGLATGFPISPRGITGGSILGMILHPTERHAAYDVTSATPTVPADDSQPGTPAAPVRAPDWNDNSTTAAPIDAPAPIPDPPRDSGYTPSSTPVDSGYTPPAPAPEPSYSPPSYTPPDPPSYSPPDPTPSYSAPDTSYSSPSFDSGGGGGGGGD